MEKMIGAGQVDDAIDLAMEVITDYKKENDRLGIPLKAAIRAKDGRKSEKLSPEQLGELSLMFDEEESASKSDGPPVPVTQEEKNVYIVAKKCNVSAILTKQQLSLFPHVSKFMFMVTKK